MPPAARVSREAPPDGCSAIGRGRAAIASGRRIDETEASTWHFGFLTVARFRVGREIRTADWNPSEKRGVLLPSKPIPANRFRRAEFGIRRPARSREGTLWGAFVASGFGVRSLTAAPSGRRCHLRPRARESLAILRFALLRARSMANSSRAVSSSFAALAASACTVTRRVNSSSAVAREESSAELAAIHRSLHRSARPGPPRADRSARPGPPRADRSARPGPPRAPRSARHPRSVPRRLATALRGRPSIRFR